MAEGGLHIKDVPFAVLVEIQSNLAKLPVFGKKNQLAHAWRLRDKQLKSANLTSLGKLEPLSVPSADDVAHVPYSQSN